MTLHKELAKMGRSAADIKRITIRTHEACIRIIDKPTPTLREAATQMIEKHHHRLVVVAGTSRVDPAGGDLRFDIVAQMAQPGSEWQA